MLIPELHELTLKNNPPMKNLLLLLCIFPLFLWGQDFQPKPNNGQLVNHTYFSLSYSEEHEQAEWVYYKLTKAMIYGSVDRTDDFRADPFVSTGSATLSDYRGSGYDRGHLAPAADMKLSSSSMSESFYLSNMSPQNPSFNRGAWKKLESLVRYWIHSKGPLFIVTGPIFKNNIGSIGPNNVSVPGHYYKIVYSDKNKEMIGFVLPNKKIEDDLKNYVRSVDYIEGYTDLDFFYHLEDSIENALESSTQTSVWKFNNTTSFSKRVKQGSKSTSAANQCLGTAKSTGNQCRLSTKNENGYCYVHQNQSPGYIKPAPTNYSGRCNATTKAGNRCKRNAASGSRYCWQH